MIFKPVYSITNGIARDLMRIEAAKYAVIDLPMTVMAQRKLRETARLCSTHYSTEIEGNRLTLAQAEKVVHEHQSFPDRKRDEQEVLGYYRALDEVEKLISKHTPVSEDIIKLLHACVINGYNRQVKPTAYRDGQNVIKDSISGKIVYMPPEAKDVPALMNALVIWVNQSLKEEFPVPLIAGAAHYQFATIHPYYDGNGRTARLLTTYIMHLAGYGLKGFYSLEEYYSRNLAAYYQALTIGPSHNYYLGRAEAAITVWLEYFCGGVAESFEKVKQRAEEAAKLGNQDKSPLLRKLDARQRQAIGLFQENERITSLELAQLFNIKSRTASELCNQWCEKGFIIALSAARKNRKYSLAEMYQELLD